MNYKTLVLSIVIGACFLEIEAMKKTSAKKASSRTPGVQLVTEQEFEALQILMRLSEAKTKEETEIPLPPKKRASTRVLKKTN